MCRATRPAPGSGLERRGTPDDVVAKLDAMVGEGLATAKIKQKIESLGGTPLLLSLQQMKGFVTAETERFRQVIKAAGISR